jgi:hypothetical protein
MLLTIRRTEGLPPCCVNPAHVVLLTPLPSDATMILLVTGHEVAAALSMRALRDALDTAAP